jgi:integrase
MTNRRPYGSGSLQERPDRPGYWTLRVWHGVDPGTNKRRRKVWTFKANGRKAAERRAAELVAALDVAQPVGSKMTVAALLNEFMKFSEGRGRSPKTLHEHRRTIDNFLVPAIGSIRIDQLTPHDLDSLYASAQTKERPLAPATIRRYHAIIAAALNQAVKWEWLVVSPASKVTLPALKNTQPDIPSPQEVRDLIAACYALSELLGVFAVLAAVTGARRGELAALRWSAVQGNEIRIDSSVYSAGNDTGVKSTKTGQERILHAGPWVVDVLENWRRSCELQAEEFRVELEDNGFVFAIRPDGHSPINIDTITSMFRRAADSLDPPLTHVHLHSLRHFAATELLAAGVNPRDAANRLGHADPALTLRVYAHATNERQREAGQHAEDALGPLTK